MVVITIRARVPKNRKILLNIPKNIPVDATIELQISFQARNTDNSSEIGDDTNIQDDFKDSEVLDEGHVVILSPPTNRTIKGRITGKSIAEPEPIVSFEKIDMNE